MNLFKIVQFNLKVIGVTIFVILEGRVSQVALKLIDSHEHSHSPVSFKSVKFSSPQKFLGPNEVIGLTMVDDRSRHPSDATYRVSSEELKCLTIHANQYSEILQRFQALESEGNVAFLRQIMLFNGWPKERLTELCRQATPKVFQTKNQLIAKEGTPITHTIFVKQGLVRVDKTVAIQSNNYWPSGRSQWEQSATIDSRVCMQCFIVQSRVRRIMEIKPKEYFGVINIKPLLTQDNHHLERYYSGDIVADQDGTVILMIPNRTFRDCKTSQCLTLLVLEPLEFETLFNGQIFIPNNINDIRMKAQAKERFKQMKRSAFLNAANIRIIPAAHRDFYIEPRVKRLQAWATSKQEKIEKPQKKLRFSFDTQQLHHQEDFSPPQQIGHSPKIDLFSVVSSPMLRMEIPNAPWVHKEEKDESGLCLFEHDQFGPITAIDVKMQNRYALESKESLLSTSSPTRFKPQQSSFFISPISAAHGNIKYSYKDAMKSREKQKQQEAEMVIKEVVSNLNQFIQ